MRVSGHQGPAPFTGAPIAYLAGQVVHRIRAALVARRHLIECRADVAPVHAMAAHAVGGVGRDHSSRQCDSGGCRGGGCHRGGCARRSNFRTLNLCAFPVASLQRAPAHRQHARNDHQHRHNKCRCKPTRALGWRFVFRVHICGLWWCGAGVSRESHGIVGCGLFQVPMLRLVFRAATGRSGMIAKRQPSPVPQGLKV